MPLYLLNFGTFMPESMVTSEAKIPEPREVVALTIARTPSSRSSSLYTGRRPIPDLRIDLVAHGRGCDMPE
jgi:hypothetical protein